MGNYCGNIEPTITTSEKVALDTLRSRIGDFDLAVTAARRGPVDTMTELSLVALGMKPMSAQFFDIFADSSRIRPQGTDYYTLRRDTRGGPISLFPGGEARGGIRNGYLDPAVFTPSKFRLLRSAGVEFAGGVMYNSEDVIVCPGNGVFAYMPGSRQWLRVLSVAFPSIQTTPPPEELVKAFTEIHPSIVFHAIQGLCYGYSLISIRGFLTGVVYDTIPTMTVKELNTQFARICRAVATYIIRNGGVLRLNYDLHFVYSWEVKDGVSDALYCG